MCKVKIILLSPLPKDPVGFRLLDRGYFCLLCPALTVALSLRVSHELTLMFRRGTHLTLSNLLSGESLHRVDLLRHVKYGEAPPAWRAPANWPGVAPQWTVPLPPLPQPDLLIHVFVHP